MEEERKRYYRLGVFVIVSITLLLAVLFMVGGRKLFQRTSIVETYFDSSVAGLEIGARVKYRGVPIGEVYEIITSAAAYEEDVPIARRRNYIVVRAKVTVSGVQAKQLERDAPELIKMGLRAQTELSGVTGQQYLALDMFEPAKHPALPFDWRPEYRYVPSVPSRAAEIVAHVQQFLANLSEADVQGIVAKLTKLLTTVDDKVSQLQVGQLSADVDTLLKLTKATVLHVDTLVSNPGLTHSIENTAAVTARLRELAESGALDSVIGRIDQTVERLDEVIGDNQYDVRTIVQDLRDTAGNLRALSVAIKRYPAGALIGGPPEKVRLPEARQ